MEKIVKSCGECPFILTNKPAGYHWCDHDEAIDDFAIVNFTTIHPNCPEKGPFIITTKKIEDD